MKKTKTNLSTYEREMQNPRWRKQFEKDYKELVMSELLLAMAAGDEKSVRLLAKEAGMHPNAIQNLKSGKANDIKLSSFMKLASAYGWIIELVKGRTRMPLQA